jgi:3-hydroxybutyryl-CoA dehydrogenase
MASKEIRTVGIIGAGTMGQGIAQVCSTSGFTVLIYDVSQELLQKGISIISNNFQASVDKGKLTSAQKHDAINKITPCKNLEEIKTDLIIEAAIEKLEIKKNIFAILEKVNSADCILTSNTSSIPITQIASQLSRPEQFAGLHFFNPAHIMKLVEIISGVSTSPSIITSIKSFTENLGKIAVTTKDSPGFIVNRVARHYYVEALKILEEDATDITTIDALLRSTGFKMGAFELMDLIGVDTNFSVTTSMFNAFHQDPKFRPSRIQQQKVDAGHYGKKSGRGFYDYHL